MNNLARPTARILTLAVLVPFMIFFGLYAWSIPSVRQRVALATTERPEPFTELYFEHPSRLPRTALAGTLHAFQFTIHNLEDKDMTYHYDVYAKLGSARLPLDHNTVLVRRNDYRTIAEPFGRLSAFPRTEIVVNLINKHQQIDFWMEGKT